MLGYSIVFFQILLYRRKIIAFTISILLLMFAIDGCSGQEKPDMNTSPVPVTAESVPLPRGSRQLSIDITEGRDGDFNKAFDLAADIGIDVTELSIYWDEIETSPDVYNPETNWLAIANAFYSANNTAVSLTISVIDTTSARLPADLADRPFDDPEMIQRFNNLLDYAAVQIPDMSLTSISIGNEVDIYLRGRQWKEYEQFYQAVSVHAHELWPDTPVGVKSTFDGLTGNSGDSLFSLNRKSDAIFITYYPLKSDFTVREPETVLSDFDTISRRYPERPLYFLELGYPSGKGNNSSESMQAEFIRRTFQAWDSHMDQVKLISFAWLTDINPRAVKEYERYYGISNGGFSSYLGTLGLRTFDDEDKKAFQALREETEKRNW